MLVDGGLVKHLSLTGAFFTGARVRLPELFND